MKILLKKSFALLFLFALFFCGRLKCRQRNLVQRGRSGSNPKNTIPSKDNQKPEVAPQATAGKDNQKPEVAPQATAGKDNQKPEVATKPTADKDNKKTKGDLEPTLDNDKKSSQEANFVVSNEKPKMRTTLNEKYNQNLQGELIIGKSRTWLPEAYRVLDNVYKDLKKELQDKEEEVKNKFESKKDIYTKMLKDIKKESNDKKHDEIRLNQLNNQVKAYNDAELQIFLSKGRSKKGKIKLDEKTEKKRLEYNEEIMNWKMSEINTLTQKLNALNQKNNAAQQVLLEIKLLDKQKKELDGELKKLEEEYKQMKQSIKD